LLYQTVKCDCLEWLSGREQNSIHAVITDPPYGLVEYSSKEIAKLKNGQGGIWRLPPEIGGNKRAPVPRITVLSQADIKALRTFFLKWGKLLYPILVPGGHIFIATHPLLAHIVFDALDTAGFEKRAEIVRRVRTLRGGDRPKNAENEFADVCVMPRSCWEPWGLFRRPLEGRVQDNLRKWKTGGLRRNPDGTPFPDVIPSGRTPKKEKKIAPHPSLKPQKFLRQLVWASLPLGEGTILDPFMGSGSTLAACEALGYPSIGIEIDDEYYAMAQNVILLLAKIEVKWQMGSSTSE
jgi:site-specific DNA-methyltransferase (adenine-specific)